METKFMNAMSNETRYNRSYYSCGVPPADSFHIFRDAVTGDIPWPGALLGLSTLGLYGWGQDQVYQGTCFHWEYNDRNLMKQTSTHIEDEIKNDNHSCWPQKNPPENL